MAKKSKGYYRKETLFGDTFYYNAKGDKHRTGGPAIEWADGSKEWYVNGKCHRTGGPAIEWAGVSKEWYVNGKRHRTDGPAIECVDGTKSWWVDDKRHRTDGPAIECVDGTKLYYMHGTCLSKEEYLSWGGTLPADTKPKSTKPKTITGSAKTKDTESLPIHTEQVMVTRKYVIYNNKKIYLD